MNWVQDLLNKKAQIDLDKANRELQKVNKDIQRAGRDLQSEFEALLDRVADTLPFVESRREQQIRHQEQQAQAVFTIVVGAFVGAVLMFFFDPEQGRRRRALLRDQIMRATQQAEDQAAELGQRAKNSYQETRSNVENATNTLQKRAQDAQYQVRAGMDYLQETIEEVTDVDLVQRVRSELSNHVWQPHLLDVTAENGKITLRGQLPQDQINRLMSAIAAIPGVREVENDLHTI
jgi:gas vesicle protein